MSGSLEIDGKNLLPISEIVGQVSYSRDYLTRLAREEKIVAQLISRQWYVDLDSVLEYESRSKQEQLVRQQQLSEERKRERLQQMIADEFATLNLHQHTSSHAKAVSVTALTLAFGVVLGWGFVSSSLPTFSPLYLAQVLKSYSVPIEVVIPEPSEIIITESQAPVQFAERTLSHLSTEAGVLLLPSASSTAVTELFSDAVEVVTAEDGTTLIRQINPDGTFAPRAVPFVVVPVTREQSEL